MLEWMGMSTEGLTTLVRALNKQCPCEEGKPNEECLDAPLPYRGYRWYRDMMTTAYEPLAFKAVESNLSMSMLGLFARCRRRWMYRYEYGLVSKTLPEYVHIGAAFHAALAEVYRAWRDAGKPINVLEAAQHGLRTWFSDNPSTPPEQLSLVADMVTFWWQNEGSQVEQDYSEIVCVEEPIPLNITYFQHPNRRVGPVPIRCTPDLLARRRDTGRMVLVDHKTVGRIGEALDFLPIDFQLRSYALAVYQKYGEAPEVDYNLVRRELPPNFTRADGSQPYALTAGGKKSTRSTAVTDYVQRVRQVFTPKQLKAFEIELSDLVSDVAQAWAQRRFPRSIIKAGGSACGLCEYLPACTRELDGERLDGVTLSLTYNREPLVVPQSVAPQPALVEEKA